MTNTRPPLRRIGILGGMGPAAEAAVAFSAAPSRI